MSNSFPTCSKQLSNFDWRTKNKGKSQVVSSSHRYSMSYILEVKQLMRSALTRNRFRWELMLNVFEVYRCQLDHIDRKSLTSVLPYSLFLQAVEQNC